jgi:four helix bundle protein
MRIERFEDLDCWKQARVLTRLVYRLCENRGLNRDGRLRDQLTGASVSVMNNIAEGFGNQSNAEFKRFLPMPEEEFQETYVQAETTRKIIDGFLRYLRGKRVTLSLK